MGHYSDWRLGDTDGKTQAVGNYQLDDIVVLRGGTKPLRILGFVVNHPDYWNDGVVMEYLHSKDRKTASLLDIRTYVPNRETKEEPKMSKYGNQSHDQIFEALVDDLYYTVKVRFENQHSKVYNYRVTKGIELEADDVVAVSVPDGIGIATVVEVDKNKDPRAVAWVIQKVDTTAHDQRTEEWTTLYEGVKKSEMQKKKEILAGDYSKDLLKYAPDAAAILSNMTSGLALIEASKDDNEGVVVE